MLERKATMLNQQFIKFLIPTILISVSTSLSLTVDSILVGNFLGSQALTAVTLVLPLVLLVSAGSILIGVGGSSLYSIALGSGEQQKAREYFTVSMRLTLGIGVAFCVLGFLAEPYLTRFLVKDAIELAVLVSDYMKATILLIPFSLLSFVLPFFIRSIGWTTLASVIVIAANGVNVVLDVILIKVLGLGIYGAGLATGIGNIIGVFIALIALRNAKKLRRQKLSHGFWKTMGDIVKMGAPNALNSILAALRIFAMNALILLYLGTVGATTFSVCNSFFSFTGMFITGIAMTMLPFLGTLYGEKDFQGIRFTIKIALTIAMSASFAFLLLVEWIPAEISALFGIPPGLLMENAVIALRIYALSVPILDLLFIAIQVFQIIEHTKLANSIVLVEGFLAVVVVAWILIQTVGAEYIWWAFLLGELLSLGMTFVMSKCIQKKQPELKGFFLLNAGAQGKTLDVTMIQTNEQAMKLSEQVIAFCKQNSTSDSIANRVGVALEEMAINTIGQKTKHAKESYIDVRLVIDETEIRIIFKDNGTPYNPLVEQENTPSFGNIAVALAMADAIDYDNVLGMNRTIVKMGRTQIMEVIA